jgi:hypothetical protein
MRVDGRAGSTAKVKRQRQVLEERENETISGAYTYVCVCEEV